MAFKLTLQERVRLLKDAILPNSQDQVDALTQQLQQAHAKIDEAFTQASHSQAKANVLLMEKAHWKRKCMELEQQLTTALVDAANSAEEMLGKIEDAHQNLKQSQKEVKKFKAQKDKQYELAKAYKKCAEDMKIYKTTCKGVYTDKIRDLAMFIKDAGCAQEHVGEIIERVFNAAGISVQGCMSARTVGRIVTEKGIAAQIQLGYEMAVAPVLGIAGDGTTHENINFEARLVHLVAEDYTDDTGKAKPKQVTRLLGVHSATDHTSETQLEGWKKALIEVIDILMNSPLAKLEKIIFSIQQLYLKLKGMNSDHAEDQKKLYRLWQKIKRDAAIEALGMAKVLDMPPGALHLKLAKLQVDVITDSGGEEAWLALPEDVRKERSEAVFQDLIIEVREEEWSLLSDERREEMLESFWVGCSMHKDPME